MYTTMYSAGILLWAPSPLQEALKLLDATTINAPDWEEVEVLNTQGGQGQGLSHELQRSPLPKL